MRVSVASTLLALALVVAGCGSDDEPQARGSQRTATITVPAETIPSPPAATGEEPSQERTVAVYFLLHGRVQPVARRALTPAVARSALEALVEGPSVRERAVGLTSAVPAATTVERLVIAGGVATVDLEPCPPLAQVVFTLTQFPTVDAITGSCAGGDRLTRADFEDDSPQILVESPLLDEAVESPAEIRGSANTFEATLQVDLVDADGDVVAHKTITATSGSGTRGTFEASLPFDVARPGGALVVYELSAEDGSRTHEVRIPLRLVP